MNTLDIRLPIGILFTALGVLLTAYGLLSDTEIYRRSLGHNVNLGWGVVVLAFGVTFLILGRRGSRASRSDVENSEPTPTGE